MNESPVLIHVWEADPEREGAAVQHLERMFSQIASDPGLVAARALESADRGSIAAVLEMRSVEDRRRLEQLPDVREALDHLDGTVNLVVRLYHEVAATEHA